MTKNLDIQTVADLVEDATRHNSTPWRCVSSSDGGFYGVVDRNGSVVAGSPSVSALIAQAPTFIPALLSRLEQAEQAVERKQEALDTVARIVETQCEAVALATDSQDLIGEEGDGDWDAVWGRLSELADAKRTAERAVARVREALSEVQTRGENIRAKGNNGSIYQQERAARGEGYLEATRLAFRALDGDGRG